MLPFVDGDDEYRSDQFRKPVRRREQGDIFKTIYDEHRDRGARKDRPEVLDCPGRFFSGREEKECQSAGQKGRGSDHDNGKAKL